MARRYRHDDAAMISLGDEASIKPRFTAASGRMPQKRKIFYFASAAEYFGASRA